MLVSGPPWWLSRSLLCCVPHHFPPPADSQGNRLLCEGAAFAYALRSALNGVCGLECFDAFGEFSNAEPWSGARLWSRSRKAGLEQVTQGRQLGQIGVVGERV